MNNRLKKAILIGCIVLILLTIPILLIWMPFLPAEIATHYDANGVGDRVGSKFELLLFPATNILIAGIIVGSFILLKQYSKGEYKRRVGELIVLAASVVVMLGLDFLAIFFTARAQISDGMNPDFNIYQVLTAACAIITMTVGVIMLSLRPNIYLGVRTEQTIDDPAMWRKTNVISGWILAAVSLVGMVLNLFLSFTYGNLVIFVGLICASSLFSLFLPSIFSGKFGKEVVKKEEVKKKVAKDEVAKKEEVKKEEVKKKEAAEGEKEVVKQEVAKKEVAKKEVAKKKVAKKKGVKKVVVKKYVVKNEEATIPREP
jgi:uncharacterized membrane protein